MDDLSLEELQAKFREVQSIETSYKLSERNVVEIMLKLMQLGLVDLIFTQSGKEYITHKQLEREIQDELLLHRGRINIVDLQPLLNVDISVIEKKVGDLVKKDRKLQLIEGELIASYYLHGIAEEINETLQETGELKIFDLVKRFNFDGEHLQSLIYKYLGTVIQGHMDKDTLYTDAFVTRHTARIRGVFSAVTKPTSMSSAIAEYKFKESLFIAAMEKLIAEGRLHGDLQGRIYVPHIFDKARQSYVDNFYKQNKFIEFATLEKLYYPAPKQWLETKYPGGLSLSSHYVDVTIISMIDGTIEDTIKGDTWVDITPLVPSVLNSNDVSKIIEKCTIKKANVYVLNEVYVVAKGFLDKCIKMYEGYIKEKAEKGLLPRIEESVEEEEEETTSKKGKGKATKKAAAKPKKKEEKSEIDKELVTQFQKWFEDLPEDLIESILLHLRTKFTSIREEAARALFVGSNPETKHKTNTIIDELNTLYANIQLFEKGLLSIEDEVLEKHLLKTLCTDLVNRILQIQAVQCHLKIEKVTNASEQSQVLSQLPAQLSKNLQKLVTSLNGKSVKVFLTELDTVADKCEIMLRPLDKKQEKNLLMTHRQMFLDQLVTETNPAAVFHLVVVILYLKKNGVVVHAAGRSVPVIYNKLKDSLAPDVAEKLSAMQTLVIKFLTSPDEEVKSALNKQLPAIKELVLGKEESSSEAPAPREERRPKESKEPVAAPVEEEKKSASRRKARRDND